MKMGDQDAKASAMRCRHRNALGGKEQVAVLLVVTTMISPGKEATVATIFAGKQRIRVALVVMVTAADVVVVVISTTSEKTQQVHSFAGTSC
mmetsp:Transcript_37025/g.76956  ORF Transcript_37025/g.76956 Transcript_37025/m.76956 type:complete len:92 (+) Transcript_37025:431-706(+)